MRKILANRKRLAMLCVLAVGLLAAGGTVAVRSAKAFTLIELTAFFSPVELIGLDTANVVVTNMLSREVHVQVVWTDGVTGTLIEQFDGGFVMPGRGLISPNLPAPLVTLPAVQHTAVASLKVSPAPGGAPLSASDLTRIAASVNVLDSATHKVTVSRGLSAAPTVF